MRQSLVYFNKTHRTDWLWPTGQETVLLQTPLLLNALRLPGTGFSPSLFIMRLQAYLAQALPPTAFIDRQFLRSLDGKDDPTINDINNTVLERWGFAVFRNASVL